MAIAGYIRVSSTEQNLDRQKDALKAKSIEFWFEDKLSGKDTERAGLKSMLAFVRQGDIVYVSSLDRLARSLSDLLKIVERLKAQGVRLVSLKESIDTETAQGRMQLGMFGVFSEFEREIIAERRNEGIASARARGKLAGRPATVKPKDFAKEVKAWRAGKQTAVETFTKLKISKSVFYKMIRDTKKA